SAAVTVEGAVRQRNQLECGRVEAHVKAAKRRVYRSIFQYVQLTGNGHYCVWLARINGYRARKRCVHVERARARSAPALAAPQKYAVRKDARSREPVGWRWGQRPEPDIHLLCPREDAPG